jgi:hypothetical protein
VDVMAGKQIADLPGLNTRVWGEKGGKLAERLGVPSVGCELNLETGLCVKSNLATVCMRIKTIDPSNTSRIPAAWASPQHTSRSCGEV